MEVCLVFDVDQSAQAFEQPGDRRGLGVERQRSLALAGWVAPVAAGEVQAPKSDSAKASLSKTS
jgi:hypothetical protein